MLEMRPTPKQLSFCLNMSRIHYDGWRATTSRGHLKIGFFRVGIVESYLRPWNAAEDGPQSMPGAQGPEEGPRRPQEGFRRAIV